MGLGEPRILLVQRPAVGLPRRLKGLDDFEDHAPLFNVLVGVGKITVLAAAHSHVRHLGVILRRRLQQRLAALAGHKFLAAFHLPAGQPVYRLFNARRHHVLGCHHRNKSGVAHHVPYMGADIAQHGQIPPCVPLILEAGGHLLADIPVDVCQHRVPLRLIGGFHELLRQRLVDLQLRGLVVAVFLVQLCLQVRNAALCLIKLRLRRQLLQNPGGLQSLRRAPLVLHHVGKHVQRRLRVAAVGRVVIERPAHGRVLLGHVAGFHGRLPVSQRLRPAHTLDRAAGVGNGRLVGIHLIGVLALQRQRLDIRHHLLRRGLGLQYRPHRLGDFFVLAALLGQLNIPRRLFALAHRAVQTAISAQKLLHLAQIGALLLLEHGPFPPQQLLQAAVAFKVFQLVFHNCHAVGVLGDLVLQIRNPLGVFLPISEGKSRQFRPVGRQAGFIALQPSHRVPVLGKALALPFGFGRPLRRRQQDFPVSRAALPVCGVFGQLPHFLLQLRGGFQLIANIVTFSELLDFLLELC